MYDSEKKTTGSFLSSFLRSAAVFMAMVCAALFLICYVCSTHKMEGSSMEPAIPQNSVLFVDTLCYRFTSPKRFDVCAFALSDSSKLQLKRIVGLPGETIQITDGKIYINGKELEEAGRYISEINFSGSAAEPLVLGSDEYFVLGDNPDRSEDSRFLGTGPVKKEWIQGKVWFYAAGLFDFGLLF